MSTGLYNQLWREAQKTLRQIIVLDDRYARRAREPDKQLALQWMIRHYTKYVDITKRLDECYDQVVQPQKRVLIRKLLESCIARLLELKFDIITELEKTNWSYCDDQMLEEKLTPQDLEVCSPRYYYRDREIELSKRRIQIHALIEMARRKVDEETQEIAELEERLASQVRMAKELKANPPPTPAKQPLTPKEFIDPKEIERRKIAANHIRELAALGPGFPKISPFAPPIDGQLVLATGITIPGYTPPVIEEPPEEPEPGPRGRKKSATPPPPPVDTELNEAVLLIQVHERGRQVRLATFNLAQAIKKFKAGGGGGRGRKRPPGGDAPGSAPGADIDAFREKRAARIIQRRWRAYAARKRRTAYVLEEEMTLGLIQRPYIDYSYRDLKHEVEAARRERARQLQKEFEDIVLREREWVDRVHGPQFIEDISDEMREWIRVWWYTLFRMPEYPDEDPINVPPRLLGVHKKTPPDMFKEIPAIIPGIPTRQLGGSNLITGGFWATPKQFGMAQEEVDKSKGNREEKKEKMSKEEKKELREKQKAQRKNEEAKHLMEKTRGYQLERSLAMPSLKAAEKEFRKEWESLRPDNENIHDDIYVDMVKVDEAYELQNQVRIVVDELMRNELELLLDAEWEEKQKNKKKKKKRKPKKKKGKKKGGKKKKDPTSNRTLEDLLAELVRNGIVRNYKYAHMDEYIGEYGYSHFEQRELYQDPLPTWADARQVDLICDRVGFLTKLPAKPSRCSGSTHAHVVRALICDAHTVPPLSMCKAIREFCILPLGSQRVHEMAPLGKSTLIAGPPGVGKSLLVDILCTETGALLIDLSVEAVCGRYPGKKGTKMLMHLVDKVGRLLKPSVILVDNAHRDFYKKVPKPEKILEPKRMGKEIKKLAKGIKPGDQMMIIGTTNAPWLAKGKGSALLKSFQKYIYIPPMDYATRSFIWKKLIMSYSGVDRRFEVTPLAHATEFLSVETMRQAIESVMTVARRIQLSTKPLHHQEILEVLFNLPPPLPQKDQDAWRTFWMKLPLVKERAIVLEDRIKQKEKEEKEKKK